MNKKNEKCVIALDMGGTYIKYGLVLNDFSVVAAGCVPADSHSDREQLLNRISKAVIDGKCAAEKIGYQPMGVAVSTPGPFDYAAGTSHMVGKYDEIYDVDLRLELRSRAGLSDDMPIEFMQDAAAFLVGEHAAGAGKGYDSCMCVTLGTGVGYACILDNELLLNERKGPYYVLARQEYKDTGKLIEELVSGTAILKNYGVDAKTLVDSAKQGDQSSLEILFEQGKILGEALAEVKEIAKIPCIVIGGQISKGFELLQGGIKTGLGIYGDKIQLVQAMHPENAALIGAAVTHYIF